MSYPAGGATAPAGMGTGQRIGAGLSTVGNVLGVYNGVRQGGVAGYGGAAVSGANLANNAYKTATGTPLYDSSSGAGQAIGAAGNVLGIYNGVKQGGVVGYGGAAVNTAALATSAGYGEAAGGAVGAAGAVALPLALFAGQYDLFNKQSSYTPAQQYMDLQRQVSDIKNPSTYAQMKALGQDPDSIISSLMGIMEQYDPKTQKFNPLVSGPGSAGSRFANARKPL